VAGLGKQGRRKAAKRAVDLPITPAAATSSWVRPPPEECHEQSFTFPPPDGSLTHDRVIVPMTTHVATDDLVEFALIQQTKFRGIRETVCEADSCDRSD